MLSISLVRATAWEDADGGIWCLSSSPPLNCEMNVLTAKKDFEFGRAVKTRIVGVPLTFSPFHSPSKVSAEENKGDETGHLHREAGYEDVRPLLNLLRLVRLRADTDDDEASIASGCRRS